MHYVGVSRKSARWGRGGGGEGGRGGEAALFYLNNLRGVSFIVQAGNNIIKADFMHTKRTTFPTKMKIGILLEELK